MIEAEAAAEPSEREERLRMIDDSAEAALRHDRARARALRFTVPGVDRRKWTELAEMGWLMLRIREEQGGLGWGLAEGCKIAQRLGRGLTPEPILSAALIAPVLPASLAASLIGDRQIVLPAFAAFEGAAPEWRANRLSGTLEAVHFAAAADCFIVQTTDGAAIVKPGDPGVRLDIAETHDGGHFGVLHLQDVTATAVSADLCAMREEAALVLSAYLLGVSEVAFEITVEYLKERKQFGQPIGAFQALQHRSVDLLLELSLMRAAIDAACVALDEGATGNTRRRAVSLAKARAAKASAFITRSAIQLHGGIGYADEADIGLYLRKAMTLSGLLGTETFHRRRAFQLSGLMA